MEDLLKMPSQYIEQVMYSIKEQQQQQQIRSPSMATREQKRPISLHQPHEQQQQQQHHQSPQQRIRSALTSTTQTTTSASNDS